VVEVLKGVERKSEEAKKKVRRIRNTSYSIQFEKRIFIAVTLLGIAVLSKIADRP